MLAEYGLCCAGEDGSGEEGIYLKFAIKHLFALDVKLKSNSNSLNEDTTECNEQPSLDTCSKTGLTKAKLESQDVETAHGANGEPHAVEADAYGVPSQGVSPHKTQDNENVEVSGGKKNSPSSSDKLKRGEKASDQLIEGGCELTEDEKEELELKIDTALDQCFFCLYGLNIRSDSSYEDDLATHRNTSRGDYQTKEQCADVFQYILPCAKASSVSSLSLSLVSFVVS